MKKLTITPLIRQIGISVGLLWCSIGLLNAQITFASSTCGIASTTLQPAGDNGNGRNIFEFDDGNIVRAEWDGGQNRWEINLYSGDGMGGFTFCCTYVYNTSASIPNPPSLNLGAWESDFFGMDCTASGFVLSGDVQSELTAGCNDTEDPVITCPADITVDNDPGQCNAVVGIPNPNVSDDCPGVSFEYTPASGTAFEEGTTTVTATATDASDNTATCTFDVTVNDVEAPAAACQDITVNLNTSGLYNLNPNELDGGSTDNCGVAGLGINTTVFDCDDLGETFPIELTVSDNTGNFALCTSNVTVRDVDSPIVTCVASSIVLTDRNNDPGACSYSAQGTEFDATATDNCGVASLTNNYNNAGTLAGAAFPVGTTQLRWTALDATGNLDTCSIKIRVLDNTPPTALCQNLTVQLDATGNASILGSDINGGSTADNCSSQPVPGGIASLSATATAFTCSDVGENIISTLTVTDVNGNFSTCDATITVEDNVAPTAVCQNLTVQLDANGNGSATAAAVNNGSGDVCGLLSLSLSQTSFDCSEVGPNTETLTVTDVNGNTSTCNATVTVEDNNPPTAVCADPTVSLTSDGITTVGAAFFDSGSSATCSGLDFSASMTEFTCNDVGNTYDITLTVTSQSSGLSDACTATVNVADPNSFCCAPPMAVCEDITVQLDASGNASITPVDIGSGSTSQCGLASESLDIMDFGCTDVGENTVTYTITGVNDESGQCDATVTVEDNVAPTALCQNLTVQLDADGNGSITAQDVDSGSSDACGIGGLSVSPSSFGCGNTGMNTVTLTVTDVNSNTACCTAMATVEDNIAPTAACLNVTVEIQPEGTYDLQQSDVYDAANSNDNCSIASVFFPTTTFGCNDLGLTFPIVVTVTDPSSNMNNCTANVTVDAGNTLPPEWTANYIGDQGDGSFYEYDPCINDNPDLGDFTIGTGGYNLIPQNSDNLAFASVPLCGNGGIQARIRDVVGGYAGLMIRESSDPGSKMYAVYSNLTNLLRREIRYTQNGPRSSNTSYASFPEWLRLTSQGDLIRAFYRNTDGGNWVLFHQAFLPMDNCVEMGLAVFSTDPFGNATAVIGEVRYLSQGGSLVMPNTMEWTAESAPVIKAGILPNPVREAFTLQFSRPLAAEGQATLLNEFEQRITQQPLMEGETELDWNATSLPAGLYFLEVFTEDGYREVLKVVRQ